MTEAMDYLEKVKERAKELYAMSDQGRWEDLAPWMQEQWIRVADDEIKQEQGGRRV